MIRSSGLSQVELEFLLLNIHEYLRCVRRNHLALWLQGHVQALLPHRAAMAVVGNGPAGRQIEYFGRESIPREMIERLGAPVTGLVSSAVAAWTNGGRRPIYRTGPFDIGGGASCHPLEAASELFGHGVTDSKGQLASFFVFFASEPGDRSRREDFLETLIPLMHTALMRVLSSEERESPWQPVLRPALTDRELEVLRWVQQGRSNASIALELAISPLTVKNHVQSILRKMKAANRAQAVAFGISRRIIPPGDMT